MQRLASLKFTLASLAGLIIWLGLGVALGQSKLLTASFVEMNSQLIRDWLLGPAWSQPLAPLWFLLLCVGVGVMLLNLGACTITRLLPRLRSGNALKGWLLTLVHLVMLVVLLGHGAEMVLGHKQEGLSLLPGQETTLPNGLTLKLEELSFVGDPSALNLPYRRARWVWTTGGFQREGNQIRLKASRQGRELWRGQLRILEPATVAGLRLTLTDFFAPEGEGQPPVGVKLALVRNPLTTLFFVAYGLWALLYALLAVVTWRGGPVRQSTEKV
ncbi:MAG: hypothetical protein K9K66_16220 [Desulfarculaceae bacterium]|nr:hypothetical protein [Desulfarculaceae bacterium]MCF8071601.1 hypothetical protein [Desulfarculaceae bacterium]MCF8103202.1 hypothetical protein [Desulfarculaceae bacterium]MCF8114880.1 hypothetical protein [Desulfarculaceae bacterium]